MDGAIPGRSHWPVSGLELLCPGAVQLPFIPFIVDENSDDVIEVKCQSDYPLDISMPLVSCLSWWLVMGEVLFLAGVSTLGAWLMFSILPVSVAVIVSVSAVCTFPLMRQRLNAGDHFLCVSGAWFVLGILCCLLIRWLDREHFEWLLDWN